MSLTGHLMKSFLLLDLKIVLSIFIITNLMKYIAIKSIHLISQACNLLTTTRIYFHPPMIGNLFFTLINLR